MAGCKPRHGPKLRPFDLQTSGRKQDPGEPPKPAVEKPKHVIVDRGFWEDLPWEQRNYFVHDHYIPWPGAGLTDIAALQVPPSQVLMVLSFLFRATIETGACNNDVTFVRDTYLWPWARFFLEVARESAYDRVWTYPVANVLYHGTNLLNQEQAVPGISFAVLGRPNQQVTARVQIAATPVGFVAPAHLGVEMRGIWIPERLFSRYHAELER